MAKITWPPLEEKIRFSLPKKGPYEVEVNPDYGLIIYFVDDHAKSGIGLSWTKIFEMFGVGRPMTICPLMSNRDPDMIFPECFRDSCGFWDWKEKQCAIVSIGIGSMEHIREKERGG